jgi:dipeptidase E
LSKILLLSNSSNHGEQYMQWCKNIIAYFINQDTSNVLFVPYAAVSFDYVEYTDKVNRALSEFGIIVKNLDSEHDKHKAIREASAILVGGGNTFHLLKNLQENELISAIREKVLSGTPYVGWSAGSNIACPNICTTNDMPIVQPVSFNALKLFPFQINPHYTEEILPHHGGESRKQRLLEFLSANPKAKVICLPESSYLLRDDRKWKYIGYSDGKILQSKSEIPLHSGDTIKE